MDVRIHDSLAGIDWDQVKADLAADDFDNGRTASALRRSFERSQHVAIARDGHRVVGMARLLSDSVCNAYLLDVWTASAYGPRRSRNAPRPPGRYRSTTPHVDEPSRCANDACTS